MTRRAAGGRRPYHHGDLRNALVRAALKLLSRHGARGVTLREVARRVGVSHAAPYRHFSNKDALVAVVAEEGFRGLAAVLAAVRGRNAEERLRAQHVAYVAFAVAHPTHYRLMFGGELKSFECHPALKRVAGEAFDHLMSAIVAGQESREVRAGDPQLLAVACWSLVHGQAMLLIDDRLRHSERMPEPRRLSRQISVLLFEGLAI